MIVNLHLDVGVSIVRVKCELMSIDLSSPIVTFDRDEYSAFESGSSLSIVLISRLRESEACHRADSRLHIV